MCDHGSGSDAAATSVQPKIQIRELFLNYLQGKRKRNGGVVAGTPGF